MRIFSEAKRCLQYLFPYTYYPGSWLPHLRKYRDYRIPCAEPEGRLARVVTVPPPNMGPGIHFALDVVPCKNCGSNPDKTCPTCKGSGLTTNDRIWCTIETLKPQLDKPHGPLALSCHTLCLSKKSRWHVTCSFCRIRRVYERKLPNSFPVQFYTLMIIPSRPLAFLKSIILKKILTFAEYFAS